MLGTLVGNSLRALILPPLLLRRRAMVPQGAWVSLTLEGTITEIERPIRRFLRPSKPVTTIASLRALCDAVREDRQVAGVLLRIGSIECGHATAHSLREVLSGLRAAGKQTVAYLPDGVSTREYTLALACDRIYTSPQASVSVLGFSSGAMFYRSLLTRGGIDPEVIARKEFKSAGDSFARDGLSEPNRFQLNALLDRFETALLTAISEGRKVDVDTARRWINSGPYRPAEAVRETMIDGAVYEDELRARLTPGLTPKLVPAWVYLPLVQATRFRPFTSQGRVGIVEVRGAIVPRAGFSFGMVADARRITAALRQARAARDLGAVVLYVDTRGGSALASDMIAHEVERLREKKPVVAYFSDVAASGGYYVAAPAQEIIAQPTSITGSIGVIAMRFVASRALEKLGLGYEVLRRGERADLLSPYRAWSDADRAAFEREIDGFYSDFVSIVARGRGRPFDQIEPLARGRVYAGQDAKDVGLVDTLGGLDVAIARARSLSGRRLDADPVIVHPPRIMPDPAEASSGPTIPSAAAALLRAISQGGSTSQRGPLDLLHLWLGAGREHLFAYDDTLADL